MALASVNPATGQPLQTYAVHSRRALAAKVDAAHAAAQSWRALSPAARARHLRAFASALHRERASLAALVTAEMGKPLADSLAEIAKCADALRHYAAHGAAFLRPEIPAAAPKGVSVMPEPLGVVLAIMPWNYPLWQVIRAAAPALIAGNTLLLKHASNVTGCALALCAIATRAGLPAGVLDCVLAPASAIPGLIADARIAGVTLTGSTAAGRQVAGLAGAALKPFVGELGGSDPYLIFPDADLLSAAAACAAARLVNNGQSCIAAKRFIVHARVADEFIRHLAVAMASYRVGDPTAPENQLGPLARLDLRAELHSQVTRSVRRGAKLVMGGRLPPGPGAYYPPTLLADVRPGMPAVDEELFGPVAAVEIAKDEDALFTAANRSVYGLGAALFTRDVRRARTEFVPRLQAGMVFVNHPVRSHIAVPFGGTKASGLGRELGRPGVLAFTNPKTVWFA
ncbi:MAG: aldehyde dehydrogenase family protein [Opitutaceae bacterium]|jgi:succinate-semialdehyde dehydrogenase/glutarate-semialdehyde dehydrogenase|nr:aldehyde dehydrogenase family protein [Opitutaceae bacterium]